MPRSAPLETRVPLTSDFARRGPGPGYGRTTEPEWLWRRRETYQRELERERPQPDARPGGAVAPGSGLPRAVLAVAALPLLIGLALLFFEVGPGVVRLGT